MNFYEIVERAKWCYRTLSFFIMDGVKKTVLRLVLPDRAFLSVSLREEEEGYARGSAEPSNSRGSLRKSLRLLLAHCLLNP
jgi:hypothetical protein